MQLDDLYLAEERRLFEREFSGEERKALAEKGFALPDGSFPIETVADLERAIRLWGHSSNPKAAKRHIVKRARALGAVDKLPSSWHKDGKGYESAALESISGQLAGIADRLAEGVVNSTQQKTTPLAEGSQEGVDLAGASRLTETVGVSMEPQVVGSNGKHVLEVTLIAEGTSKMGNTYPREALRSGAQLFEGARAFVDHAPENGLPERSVRDLVGFYRNVRHDESSGSGRLRGELHLVPGNEWLFNLLREAENNPGLCGLSIDAWCDQDMFTKTVRGFRKVESVDVVTRPSAGGQVNRILQSERDSGKGGEAPGKERSVGKDGQTDGQAPSQGAGQAAGETQGAAAGAAAGSAAGAAGGAPATAGAGSGGGAATATLTRESDRSGEGANPPAGSNPPGPNNASSGSPDLTKLVESYQADRAGMQSELEQLKEDLRRQAEQLESERKLAACAVELAQKLSEAALPGPVIEKLRKQFSGRLFESSLLEQAISDERETLAALTAAGQITGLGYEKSVQVGFSEFDHIQAAFDKLFDVQESEVAGQVKGFSGIREAYFVSTGRDIFNTGGVDAPLTPALREALRYKVASGRLTEAESHIKEADVTTASFSYLLGTSMNKRLLKDYQAWPSEWQKFTTIVAIKDFKQQSRIRLGAFGSLSTVAEDAAYTTLSVADTQATYTATKRGNLVQITRETIINDDLYAIKQIPQKLAVAAAFTLAEFVYNLLAPNFGNIYDAHPLFDSVNHLNTGVTAGNLNTANSGSALASSALQTAVIKMRKQQNMASKPIGLMPRFLLVPPDLEFTAMTILKSAGLPGGNNNDINPMMGYCEPIVSPQLNSLSAGPTSTTIWIAVADPRVIDTLEVGFVGGQANPVLLIQDMPLYGLNFTQDVISYKVRHEYGGAVVDYRGFYLGNN